LSYKFIYFDLDDTLLDHKSAEVAALKDVYRYFPFFESTTHGRLSDVYHDVNRQQWSLYSKGKVSREQLQENRFRQTLEQLDLDGSRHNEVGRYYMQCYRDHWQWIDGARQAYRHVLNNYPVGILTNGFAETQQLKFEQFDLHKSAEHTVVSEEVGVLKPDPKVFEHATQLAGVNREEILYVGDSFSSDVMGGSRYGWNIAWFTSSSDAEKHKNADFVFDDFEALIDILRI